MKDAHATGQAREAQLTARLTLPNCQSGVVCCVWRCMPDLHARQTAQLQVHALITTPTAALLQLQVLLLLLLQCLEQPPVEHCVPTCDKYHHRQQLACFHSLGHIHVQPLPRLQADDMWQGEPNPQTNLAQLSRRPQHPLAYSTCPSATGIPTLCSLVFPAAVPVPTHLSAVRNASIYPW